MAQSSGHSSVPCIAVVEDDPDIRGMLDAALTEVGYRVEVAPRAAGAWSMIRREHPDLVIIDVHREHPEAGRMLAELLRRDPITHLIPLIVISANLSRLQALAAQPRGQGVATLEKPFDLDDLFGLISSTLGSQVDIAIDLERPRTQTRDKSPKIVDRSPEPYFPDADSFSSWPT